MPNLIEQGDKPIVNLDISRKFKLEESPHGEWVIPKNEPSICFLFDPFNHSQTKEEDLKRLDFSAELV